MFKNHPKGLPVLFFTEMWERFGFYLMLGIFVLYMEAGADPVLAAKSGLALPPTQSKDIYGTYIALVYLTPFIGGLLADRMLGYRRSIIFGGILMGLGYCGLAIPGYGIHFFLSLLMIIIGNGFFKPNISTMVGQLYPAGDTRVDSAFTIFYMGINLGAFFAPLVCGYLGDTGNPADFRWGFLAACIGMLMSLVLFIALKNKYIVTPDGQQIGDRPNTDRQVKTDAPAAPVSMKAAGIWGGVFVALFAGLYLFADQGVIGSFIFSLTIAAPGFIISDPGLSKIERDRIWVIYIIAFFVIFFWSAFEQAGASLTYFAEEQTNRSAFGTVIPASYFQSINAVAIVLLAPIFVALWGFLGRKNMEPASPVKQSLGLFLLSVGYLVIAMGVKDLEPGVRVSMLWLTSLYTIHTLGELCLSPIGLSMVNKLAPVKFASLLMGVWFLSTSAANKFAGDLSALYPEPVVSIQTIEQLETQHGVKLIPSTYDKTGRKVGDTTIIAMEQLTLGEVKDEAVRGTIRKAVEGNLVENTKKFLGFPIKTLYDFFMLFVVMSGVSAVILFLLSRRLLHMMHGVR